MNKNMDLHKNFTVQSKNQYWHGLGRRKEAVATARIIKGKGKIIVNGLDVDQYFEVKNSQAKISDPAKTLGVDNHFDYSIMVRGGGKTGQLEAARLAIAKALVRFNAEFKQTLKKSGFLTTDDRIVERKKPGLKKARRSPQWSKR